MERGYLRQIPGGHLSVREGMSGLVRLLVARREMLQAPHVLVVTELVRTTQPLDAGHAHFVIWPVEGGHSHSFLFCRDEGIARTIEGIWTPGSCMQRSERSHDGKYPIIRISADLRKVISLLVRGFSNRMWVINPRFLEILLSEY